MNRRPRACKARALPTELYPLLAVTFIPDGYSRGKWITRTGSDQEDGPLFFGAFFPGFLADFFAGALAAIGKDMECMTSRIRSTV